MKKKNIFILTVLLFTMHSCIYIDMNHFDRDDKVWLSPYHEGDTVLFRSRSGCDTLVVKKCYYNDTYVPFFFSTARNVMNAESYVDMKVIHKNDSLVCMLGLEREDDGTRISINFDDKLEEGKKADIELNHKRIGKDDYNDIVFCTGKSSIYPSKNIEHYYWSKSKGLIQYKYLTGETYSLYKILPNKREKKKKE